MSQKYTGGFITKSPVAPTTTAASGIWTLDQQQQAQKAGTWPSPPIFIEDLFSTYLYTGNGSTQTITNGIDVSGKGGLVWIKDRTTAGSFHRLTDTERGAGYTLGSNATNGQSFIGQGLQTFTSTGFSIGSNADFNQSSDNYVSWTLRKQPKFFDVLTYTGTGSAKTVAHNLGSVPGCIIVKATNSSTYWATYHTSLGNTKAIELNTTNSAYTSSALWNNTSPTSTQFTVGTSTDTNDSGITYVAYLFAHDAGGFPVSGGGSTNAISCGSFSTDGSGNATVNLGYEPQWLMYKCSSAVGDWEMVDVMRGWVVGVNNDNGLRANSSDAESTGSNRGEPSSTGFNCVSFPTSRDFIYIAIRRGPMKTPTVGTSVFDDNYGNNLTGAGTIINSSMLVDMFIQKGWSSGSGGFTQDRLRGPLNYLVTSATDAESSTGDWRLDQNTGVGYGSSRDLTGRIGWMFRRAPSFFDQVCYSGNGSTQNITHNLSVVPEFIIVKPRNSAVYDWNCYNVSLGNTQYIALNTTATPSSAVSLWNNTTPTSTVFTVNHPAVNDNNGTYVAYLFATLAGVSKVGSYTGDNTDGRIINCGFTTGARFVLIRRTDQAGQWAVWDSARGITSGNDPYLMLNNTSAEVTGFNDVGTTSTGFTINATSPGIPVNVAGSTYIFLAIA